MNRFLIDENLPADLVGALGIAAIHATDLAAQLSDEDLWSHARKESLVIVTRDADFFHKLAVQGAPPQVIWIRTGNLRHSDLVKHIANAWPRIQELLIKADLVEVHLDRLEAIKF